MPQPQNAMEIFKLLPKTNCRECNETTCLAFAGAVFTGRKPISRCPHLPATVLARYGETDASTQNQNQDAEEALANLKARIGQTDLQAAAKRIGARHTDGRLTLKVMGKDFSVNSAGELFSEIHVHAWLARPVLEYILSGAGRPPTGQWVPLRELKRGRDWYRLFGQTCEKPMKRLADEYTDLFEDMMHLFNGRREDNTHEADIALVLYPLPGVPMLICYWKPEDGLASSLNLFFDETAEDNLPIESLYSLGAGFVNMLEKLALRHGFR